MSLDQNNYFPQKKGRLAKDQHNNLVLLNQSGKAYSTNDAIISIWQLCSGDRSISDLCEDLYEHTQESKTELKEKIEFILKKLETAQLIEINISLD